MMERGDYVLATKYADGDPGDSYCVGFYDGVLDNVAGLTRHLVVDGEGKQFRRNGHRRVEPITDAEGRWLIERFPYFKPFTTAQDEYGEDVVVGWSVWDWLAECRRASHNTEAARSP
jgi:hypothetical protein